VTPSPALTTEPTSAKETPDADTTTSAKHTNLLSRPESMTPVYIGLAAAGIGLGTAIVFALFKSSAQSKSNEVAANIRSAAKRDGIDAVGICKNPNAPSAYGPACQTLQENNDKVDMNATAANIGLAVMGAGILLAGGWYLFAPKQDEASSPSTGRTVDPKRPVVTPYAGWQSGGLSIAGEF
jgi:hypothetical protein